MHKKLSCENLGLMLMAKLSRFDPTFLMKFKAMTPFFPDRLIQKQEGPYFDLYFEQSTGNLCYSRPPRKKKSERGALSSGKVDQLAIPNAKKET